MSEFPAPTDLTAHSAPMLQVDEILSWDGPHVTARMTVQPDNLFYVPGRGLPAYVGFEIMAQTISLQDGLMRRSEGKAPKIGLLLGCRKYSVTRDWFAAGETLIADCTALILEGELRSYKCRLATESGEPLANGVINVFKLDDLEAFLKSETQAA